MNKVKIVFLCVVLSGILISCATMMGDQQAKESIDPALLKDENKIIFLRQVPSLRGYGYQDLHLKADSHIGIAYEKLAGKYGWVILKSGNPVKTDFVIYVEDGFKVYGEAYGGDMNNIAYVDELEKARELVGAPVWFIGSPRGAMGESYSPEENGPEKYVYSLMEQFTITDVTWDCFADMPVKFALDDGNGIIRHWSGTVANLNNNPFDFRQFWNVFTLEDPQKTHPDWIESDWSVIKERKIIIGMSKEMLLMSWGNPEDINSTVTKDNVSEQFIYGDQYVYLENGFVTAWQN